MAFVHTPAFDSLERSNTSDQLLRVHEFIAAESADLDLLIVDWVEWDDMMMFVCGENEQFYEDNLADGHLRELGMSFGAIVDMEGRQIWGQTYTEEGISSSLEYIVNGQHGHETGDQLLIEVACRIRSVVCADNSVIGPKDDHNGDLVARIGGDEFVVLLTTGELPEYANDIVEGIVESVAAPYLIEGVRCHIGACVGLAIFTEDASNLNGILTSADAAMYQAKRSGKNTWRRHSAVAPLVPLGKSA